MTLVKIPYAKGFMETDIPDGQLLAILQSKAHDYRPAASETELVERALAEPVGSPRLRELAKGKNKIVIIASDHTRPVPSKIIAPLLLREIRAGNPAAEITFLIATGFHRATSHAELVEKFGEDIVAAERIAIHDCLDLANMVDIGTLPSGGRIVINKLAMEADLLVSEGFIEPHFFAGFSGGRKSVLPGIVSEVTVLANHCAKFIASPRARAGILDGNPLHIDMLHAANEAKLSFIVNVAIDADKKIIRAFAGEPVAAHEQGCAFVGELASVRAATADIVITSNGGYPLDQNLYQAVKGMSAAEATVRQGGVIIICAACNDGHGGEAFYEWFADAGGDPAAVLEKIMRIPAEETRADQWEAQILARIQQKARVIVVTDQCDPALIEAMNMQAAATLTEALRLAKAIVGETPTITVVPDGVSVIVTD